MRVLPRFSDAGLTPPLGAALSLRRMTLGTVGIGRRAALVNAVPVGVDTGGRIARRLDSSPRRRRERQHRLISVQYISAWWRDRVKPVRQRVVEWRGTFVWRWRGGRKGAQPRDTGHLGKGRPIRHADHHVTRFLPSAAELQQSNPRGANRRMCCRTRGSIRLSARLAYSRFRGSTRRSGKPVVTAGPVARRQMSHKSTAPLSCPYARTRE